MTTAYDKYMGLLKRGASAFSLAMALSAACGQANAMEPLITSAAQLESNATDPAVADNSLGNLIDGNVETGWKTDDNWSAPVTYDMHYLQVNFDIPLVLGPDEDLVVYTQRHDSPWGSDKNAHMHPTTLRIEGSNNGTDWEAVAHVYFLYRGVRTKEYSSPVTFVTARSTSYSKLRFTVTANNCRHRDVNTGVRAMAMAEFQVYRHKKGSDYSDILVDRFHLKSDYNRAFEDYTFVNTRGVMEAVNRKECELILKGDPYASQRRGIGWASLNRWSDWSGWNSEGSWTKNQDLMQGSEGAKPIDMPDFHWLDAGNDPDVKSGVRQPTHVTEHTLYAVPGDVVALYPYYDLYTQGNYHENFSHWYDYQTGGHVEDGESGLKYLDFLIDPSGIGITGDFGFVGGGAMVSPKEYDLEIGSVDEYLSALARVNGGETNLRLKLTADLDFGGRTIAPMGNDGNRFSGVFDGGGHKISNVTIEGINGVGLIGYATDGAVVQNIMLDKDCHIKAGSFAGLVGVFLGSSDGSLLVSNAVCMGTVTVNPDTGINAAGILGSNWNNGFVIIRDCVVGGTISAPESWYDAANEIYRSGEAAAISGWMGENYRSVISNCYSIADVSGIDGDKGFYRGVSQIINCYDKNRGNWVDQTPADVNSDEFVAGLGEKWGKGPDGYAVPVNPNPSLIYEYGNRSYGTVATFFYPRDVYYPDGIHHGLPQDYVIAADFSQSFAPEHNIDRDGKRIIEPVIHFRHIFRICDGIEFANKFSGTIENNEKYIKETKRIVSAPEGVKFQLRLDSPVPVEQTTRSKYYYKVSDTDYRRVCSMDVCVYDSKGNLVGDQNMFYLGWEDRFFGQGSREIEGVTYNICGGGGSYYRMLHCRAEDTKAGRYIVRLIGRDVNNERIKIVGSDKELVVQEYDITFVPKTSASMIRAEELEKPEYSDRKEENLEALLGAPKDKVDFDEYRRLENIGNESDYFNKSGEHRVYKWPVEWVNSQYAFGYEQRHDYNMYVIANHSSVTPYHAAADNNKSEEVNFGMGDGLFDRLFYKTKGRERGYFYYVNAATDPGVMARLKVEDLCQGSTIHVSAWVAEFSQNAGQTANLAFNFVAKLKTGERVVLHSFVTGYVDHEKDDWGKWMNVYYSFVPDFSNRDISVTSEEVEYYYLELDNNCNSSAGADYAVDNIRLYVARPVVDAQQTNSICHASEPADIRIETPFEVVLQSLGLKSATGVEDAATVTMFYTFLDKKIYEESIAAGMSGTEAFDAAVLKYKYMPEGDESQTFGRLEFSSYFEANPAYDATQSNLVNQAGTKIVDGNKVIAFNTRPYGKTVVSGREYIVALYSWNNVADEGMNNPGADQFDIMGDCAKTHVFRIQASGDIKIDGELRQDRDRLTCCENQSPVVQVDLYGKKTPDGPVEELVKNAYFDWFSGSIDEYMSIEEKGINLAEAMIIFRSIYPKAENCNVEPDDVGGLTKEMLVLIDKYTKPMAVTDPVTGEAVTDPETGEPQMKEAPLLLYKSSYVFAPVTIPPGDKETYCYVLAIPIDLKEEGYYICSQPTEVRIAVRHHAPGIYHGLSEGIDYPEHISDVPLRVGLRQLDKVSVENSQSAIDGHRFRLNVPVRRVNSVTASVKAMKLGNDPLIYLVATDDVAYKDLDENEPTDEPDGLMPIGEVTRLTAVKGGTENIIEAVFFKGFEFKEGYYYRMRFNFEENVEKGNEDSDIIVDEGEAVCSGQHVFTLKVVPEYQRWNGGAGLADDGNFNWNNDANWERVDAGALKFGRNYDDRLVVGGRNGSAKSYAPLDFTKVIIPAGNTCPMMFDIAKRDVTVTDNIDGLVLTYTSAWSIEPSTAVNGTMSSGAATTDIEYDMASRELSGKGLFCRAWYANTCGQVHFNVAGEIHGQQWLDYEKAWVDMELDRNRWYTLSSPLQGVVAGDMYAPSATGRQETELFQQIVYDESVNNRFHPAVFQRSWNKGRAMVYEIGDVADGGRDVAVKTIWSHVYNSVWEKYAGGEGYSIKPELAGEDGGKVLFRLPKADDSYKYYDEGGTNAGTETAITRGADRYKLNGADVNVTVKAQAPGKYFLAGNPYMAHLDMKEFFDGNPHLNRKFWIVTADGQVNAMVDAAGGVTGTFGTEAIVAPMQGFFVETAEESASVALSFTSSMTRVMTGDETGPLGIASRGDDEADDGSCLRISAVRNGARMSEARVKLSAMASQDYDESEDMAFLDNESLGIEAGVYTVAGNVASSINVLREIEGTEVGIAACDGERTILCFTGVGAAEGMMLYDARDGSYTPIEEGMEYEVDGSAHGRLFITAGKRELLSAGLTVDVHGNRVVVRTASEAPMLDVTVHDTLGRKVASLTEYADVVTLELDSGVYVLDAADRRSRLTSKISIR